MRRICVVVGSRANYSSIKSVMRSIEAHSDLQLQIVAAASALLDRYGSVVKLIERDGFKVDARVHMLVEGETPQTMAKSTGLGLMELPTIFDYLNPDIVLTVGDRFETIATAIAAAYMNIPLAHTMGGEVSGTIDESIRHAITKFAHIHFPASRDAAERIIRLGEAPESVHLVGCPRMDLVAEILKAPEKALENGVLRSGVGDPFDLNGPFVLVSQHPVTTEYGRGMQQVTETLQAVKDVSLPALVLWPNADAGSEDIARGIRVWREHGQAEHMHFFKNLPSDTYIALMARTACLVGNSSSGIREGAFIGTPVVNVGTRQSGRERGHNVVDVPYEAAAIRDAMSRQIAHGRYDMDPIYGSGQAAARIAGILADVDIAVQKRITF